MQIICVCRANIIEIQIEFLQLGLFVQVYILTTFKLLN